jgi:hypothetical protein
MTEVLSFMGDHPFLSWFLAWGLWPVCWAASAVLTTPFKVALRAYRLHIRGRNVRAHGWPRNPLMDADGDIVHRPQPEKANP